MLTTKLFQGIFQKKKTRGRRNLQARWNFTSSFTHHMCRRTLPNTNTDVKTWSPLQTQHTGQRTSNSAEHHPLGSKIVLPVGDTDTARIRDVKYVFPGCGWYLLLQVADGDVVEDEVRLVLHGFWRLLDFAGFRCAEQRVDVTGVGNGRFFAPQSGRRDVCNTNFRLS